MPRTADPARRRRIRLVVALSAALLLATALIYTTFTAGTSAMTPSQLLASSHAGGTYQLSGRVVSGSVVRQGERLRFRVSDRSGGASVPVTYSGTVPDPFREGREVIVTGRWSGGQFAGQRNSLITKCPSKFQDAPPRGR